jgi:hypothetical protein
MAAWQNALRQLASIFGSTRSEKTRTVQSLSGTREVIREFPKKTELELRCLTAEAEQSGEAADSV